MASTYVVCVEVSSEREVAHYKHSCYFTEKRIWEVSIFDCHLDRSLCTCLL